MAIDIFNYDGTLLTTVVDGTVNNSSASINFFGRGYKGWGGPLQQNMLWMLENFSRETPPSNPVTGQLWFDLGINNDTKIIRVWDGINWNIVGPLGASSPENDPISITTPASNALESIRMLDTGGTFRNVWRISMAGTILAILSKDAEFTPESEFYIQNGFPKIYPGITFNSDLSSINVGVAGDTTSFKTNQNNAPSIDNVYNMGTAVKKFANLYTASARVTRVVLGNGAGSVITQSSDGNITLTDNGGTTFSNLQFGGSSNLYPSIKRSSAALQVRLADDSDFAPLQAGIVEVSSLTLGGATLGSNVLAATGSVFVSGSARVGSLSIAGATLGSNVLALTGTMSVSGTARAASLALNGATLDTNALAVTGSAAISGGLALNGATLSTNALAVTGTIASSGAISAPSYTASTAIASTQNDTTVATTAWVKTNGGFQGHIVLTSGTALSGTLPSGITKIKVTVVGGGGAGGGAAAIAAAAGSGGGCGAISIRYITGITSGASYSYSVGTGGTGSSGANGGNGGNSSFTLGAVTITVNGGIGGTVGDAASTPYLGGLGGTAGTSGDVNLAGSAGSMSIGGLTQATAIGGTGASGFMGMGAGRAGVGATVPTIGAVNTGAGGGGSTSSGTATAGANGASGIIIIEY